MSRKRSDGNTVSRRIVLRWLVTQTRMWAQNAERTGAVADVKVARVLAELSATFANGDER